LIFGFVSARSPGFKPALRRSLAKKSKILAAHHYIISGNALNLNRAEKEFSSFAAPQLGNHRFVPMAYAMG